jgi:hypothetical protein
MGDMRKAYKNLVGKLEGKRPHGRPRHRWEDVRMDLRETGLGWCGLDASGLGCGPVASSYEYSNEISGSIKGGEFLETLGDLHLLKGELFCGVT